MYEVVGYQYGKNNTYYEVKVWNRDKHENIRYNHVVINENWWQVELSPNDLVRIFRYQKKERYEY